MARTAERPVSKPTLNLTEDEQLAIDWALVERADHIPFDELREATATNAFFRSIQTELMSRGTTLLEGPRGCGKTHMMRYTWLLCREDVSCPLAVYVSFNRYYRLEPLLRSRTNAADLFHTWVLANILRALADTIAGAEAPGGLAFADLAGCQASFLDGIIARLERGLPLGSDEAEFASRLSVSHLIAAVVSTCDAMRRKRAVILLDDAALTLTPEYLIEFFDLVRVLRTARTAPKASVYPATDFGPRFHAGHEARRVPVWLSVDDASYAEVMGAVAAQRGALGSSVPDDVSELLKYAAFGVPRAYLTMLRSYTSLAAGNSRQRALNRVLEDHVQSRRDEYDSMRHKMPRFETVVRTGASLFEKMVDAVRTGNLGPREETQLLLGIPDEDLAGDTLRERMVRLLVEAGLVYPHQSVSHGDDRLYRRFTPHLAALIAQRAFSGASRGTSPAQVVQRLQSKRAKHPVRRTLGSLLPADALRQLRLDLPPCRTCNTPRLSDSQRFCHNCGSELLQDSVFARCMSLPLVSVPGLTAWQREKIGALVKLRTIGDLLALQDPGTALRTIPRVGNKRAGRIIDLVTSYVEEFLT
jgi:hypothetical protein